jgi:hypothetical protein
MRLASTSEATAGVLTEGDMAATEAVIDSLVVVGLVGMLNFWRLSRWCLVGALALAFVARPFLGLVVYSAFEGFFASLFSCVVMWLLTVSFWTPIAKRFAGSKGGACCLTIALSGREC